MLPAAERLPQARRYIDRGHYFVLHAPRQTGKSRLGTASPFNIKVASLRLGDFALDDVPSLYAQHTAETRQEFTAEEVDRSFRYSPLIRKSSP
jgi:hypothetical protein